MDFDDIASAYSVSSLHAERYLEAAEAALNLAVANLNAASISVLLGVGDGTFVNERRISVRDVPEAIAVGDFNADGVLDLAVGHLVFEAARRAWGLGAGVAVADELGVVAEAFAPEVAAEVLDATADWPDHQSFLARCEGEAFKQMVKFVTALYRAYDNADAAMFEINPVLKTSDSKIIAVDGKVNIDDNALYRHADYGDSGRRLAGGRERSRRQHRRRDAD